MEPRLLENTHSVVTPEYVEFDHPIAGLFTRFLAWLIDAVVVLILSAMISGGLAVGLGLFGGFGLAALTVAWFLIDWGYAIVLEAVWRGQTIGKRWLGLRVIRESGVRIGWYEAMLRNLVRPVDRLPLFYLVGGTTAVFSRAQQRLGDLLAGTLVVRERRLPIPAVLPLDASGATLISDPLFTSRLRRISAAERELIFAATLRRDELGLDARLSVFAAIARWLEREHDLARPTHFSDEKLVLCVASGLSQLARASEVPGHLGADRH